MGTVLAGLAAGHTLLQIRANRLLRLRLCGHQACAQSAYGTAEEVIAYFS